MQHWHCFRWVQAPQMWNRMLPVQQALRSILTKLATLTLRELEYCMHLFNGVAAPVHTFPWGRSACW